MTMRLEDTPDRRKMSQELRRRNLTAVVAAAMVIATMVALTFAAVPLYRLFCQVTGFAGTTQIATTAPGASGSASVTVHFDANVASNLPWRFTPPDAVKVRLGEEQQVAFAAVNLGSEPVLGTATFNVTPFAAGKYFDKIECFCFTEQLLMPGERKEFPLVFFVDPSITEDADARGITEMTLSYTFYYKGNAARDEYLRSHRVSVGAAGRSQ
jgi:cytochrome c oxidase assembly protein subunit 11